MMSKLDNLDVNQPVADPFTEVNIPASTVLSAAQLFSDLVEFFETHPQARTGYGQFLASHADADATDIHGALACYELHEAAETLRALAQPDHETKGF
jgi:hypothetical protein